ncbi:DUF3500 domain-containing protein [Pseudorhodoferax sp.]|uniref:DUF3500 domain-containing protein n=1 Tax=Pseudorhodoferax sp. TaxID=1993553 RepID=UPI002DD68073|nr:DUF3500 domain-containing protein [Pseudorhodoferax sp.]
MRLLSRWFSVLLCCSLLALSACGPQEDEDDDSPAETVPVITTQPASVQSDGSAVELRVAASGGGLSYQWYRNETAVSNATSASYSTATAGAYHVLVRNSLGEARSTTAQVTVSVDPVIVVQPASASVTAGGSARLAVVATGEGLSYQWYRGGAALNGATGASLQTNVADSYYVVVSSSRDGARPVTSASATLSVATAAQAPVITTPPVAQSVIAGRPAWFAVTATGTDLQYAWYKDGMQIAGAIERAYVLQPAASVNQGAYHVVVRNGAGVVSSAPVQLTVLPVGDGSNTGAVVAAAQAFLDTLNAAQKTAAASPNATGTVMFAATLANARAWSARSGLHHGLRLDSSLSSRQLAAAERLIAAALSAGGATMVSEIRLSDGVYARLRGDDAAGADRYSIAIFGTPSSSAPWSLQITGHQLVHNISYNAPQVSATPMFVGARPPHWAVNSAGATVTNNDASTSGTPHAALQAQRAAVAALAAALRDDSSSSVAARLPLPVTALLMAPDADSDTAYRAATYPSGTTGRGVRVDRLDTAQQAAVKAVVEAWVKTQAADVAQTLLDAYLASDALNATYVAYGNGVGGSPDFDAYPNAKALPASAANSYLRIDGPRVWIEFLVRSEDGVGGALSAQVYYSSVWRDKVADYGARF